MPWLQSDLEPRVMPGIADGSYWAALGQAKVRPHSCAAAALASETFPNPMRKVVDLGEEGLLVH